MIGILDLERAIDLIPQRHMVASLHTTYISFTKKGYNRPFAQAS